MASRPAGVLEKLVRAGGVAGFAAATAGFLAATAGAALAAAFTGLAFALGFFALALFFAPFFFLPAADFDFSARNSDLSFLIFFFSAFFSASTDLLAMWSPAGNFDP